MNEDGVLSIKSFLINIHDKHFCLAYHGLILHSVENDLLEESRFLNNALFLLRKPAGKFSRSRTVQAALIPIHMRMLRQLSESKFRFRHVVVFITPTIGRYHFVLQVHLATGNDLRTVQFSICVATQLIYKLVTTRGRNQVFLQ